MPAILLNKWVLGGLAVLALLAVTNWKSYNTGYDIADAKWVKLTAEADRLANVLLSQETAKVRAVEANLNALKDKVSQDDIANQNRINGLRIANGRLVAAAGGLFDRNGRPTGANAVCANSSPAPESVESSSGCQLSERVTNDLLDFAYRADQAATYANTCRAWVLGLK